MEDSETQTRSQVIIVPPRFRCFVFWYDHWRIKLEIYCRRICAVEVRAYLSVCCIALGIHAMFSSSSNPWSVIIMNVLGTSLTTLQGNINWFRDRWKYLPCIIRFAPKPNHCSAYIRKMAPILISSTCSFQKMKWSLPFSPLEYQAECWLLPECFSYFCHVLYNSSRRVWEYIFSAAEVNQRPNSQTFHPIREE